jgi:hypothetical protein
MDEMEDPEEEVKVVTVVDAQLETEMEEEQHQL